jgi:hypothetical protein
MCKENHGHSLNCNCSICCEERALLTQEVDRSNQGGDPQCPTCGFTEFGEICQQCGRKK